MISFTEAQIQAWLAPFLWPFLRVLAVFSAMPIFNRQNVPLRLRIALAAFITVAAQPALPPMPVIALDSPTAVLVVVQQVLIGLTFAGFFDPVTASQGTAVSSFFATLVAWAFIALNGHLIVVAALTQSFQAFPVGPEPFAFLKTAQPHRWGVEIFATGLWIALPLVAMLLFVNLVLGFISRVAPQIQIFAVGFPITLGLGLIALLFIVPAMELPFTLALERVFSTLR
jgi:flagellar biosynthetic protein FliR